jgi:hypothetical protein
VQLILNTIIWYDIVLFGFGYYRRARVKITIIDLQNAVSTTPKDTEEDSSSGKSIFFVSVNAVL